MARKTIQQLSSLSLPVQDADQIVLARGSGTATSAPVQALPFARTYALLTDMDASSIEGPVFVSGRTTAGDGYQGSFVWVAGDQSANVTADPEQGVWVAPSATPGGVEGAWKRVFEGDVDARWFGAVGDGLTDDGPALQAAFSYALFEENALFIPAGEYLVETVASGVYALAATGENVCIRGAGRDVTKIKSGAETGFGGIALTDCPVFEISGLELDSDFANQVAPPGTHNIRIGSTEPNSQDSGLIHDCTLRNSNAYGIGFATLLGGYRAIHVDHVWIYDPQRDGIDTKDHDDNEYLNFTNIHIERPSLRNGSDAGIDLRGSYNIDNITVVLDPDMSSTGVRTRYPSDETGPLGGHDSNMSNLNIDMGGEGTAFGRKGIDLGGVRTVVHGARVRNGWSNGVNSSGTIGVYTRPSASDCDLIGVEVRDQGSGFYIGSPNTRLTGCSALGCAAPPFVETSFTPQGDGFKIVCDTSNANPLLADNGVNVTLVNCRAEGFVRGFVESEVTGTQSGNRLVSCLSVDSISGVEYATSATYPAMIYGGDQMETDTTIGQGSTAGQPGLRVDYEPAATSGTRLIGTSGNPRILPDGSATNLGIELRGKGTGGGELVDGGGVRRVRTSTTGVGFQGAAPIAKPTVTGSRDGNAALASLLTALANYGLVTDSSTA